MKKSFSVALVVVGFVTALLVPLLLVRAAGYGLNEAADSAKILPRTILQKDNLPEAVGSIVSGALGLLGIVFFGIVLYSGFNWMTAMGNSEKVDKSKSMIEGALIGIIIVLLAYALTRFVFNFLVDSSTTTTDTASAVGAKCAAVGTCIQANTGCGQMALSDSQDCASGQICCVR